MMTGEQRSQTALVYRRWYFTNRWKTMRAKHLRANPWCQFCAQAGHRTKATVVDHVTRHGGDPNLFWDAGNLASLCAPHHDSAKQRQERRGYSSAVGVDGWPEDPLHPVNVGWRGEVVAPSLLPANPPLDSPSQNVPKKGS